MFITGPDVIKAVTHEEVTHGGAGRRRHAFDRSGVAHLAAPTTRARCSTVRDLLAYHAVNNAEDAAVRSRRRPGRSRATRRSTRSSPTTRTSRTTCTTSSTRVVDDGHFFEVQERFRAEHRHRLRAPRRPLGRHRRQPAGVPRRLPRHRRFGQGRALRALLRLRSTFRW